MSVAMMASGRPAQCAQTSSRLPGRAWARLLAAVGNSCMVLYIYIAYLVKDVEWRSFGSSELPEGHHQRLADYLRTWDFDAAFDQLRVFTFSEAMLQRLTVYMLVGTPVAVTLLVLETDRVRWLQQVLIRHMEAQRASRAVWLLEWYLRVVVVMLLFILAIGPCHLELPFAHYFTAGSALLCGSLSMAAYLLATADLGLLEAGLSSAAAPLEEKRRLAAWAGRVRRWVRPVLKFVLLLHVLAAAAAVWKTETLGNDRTALLFGVLETAVILGYQLFQGIFIIDDVMMGSELRAQGADETAAPAETLKSPARKGSSPRLRCLKTQAGDEPEGISDKLLGS